MDTQNTTRDRKRRRSRSGGRAGLPVRVARDLLTVRRAFGEPIERDGVTLVPVARVSGGSGYGHGESDCLPREGAVGPTGAGSGGGGGFGVSVTPVGVYVIRGTEVSWQPAFDLNRTVLGGQVVALVAVLMVTRALRRAARR